MPLRHRVSLVHGAQKNATEQLTPKYVRVSDDVPFVREDRFNYQLDKIANVKTLRVHIEKGHEDSHLTAPFGYNYQIGLHFYVKPVVISTAEEREEFYDHATEAVWQVFGVKPRETEWVHSLNLLYFHVPHTATFNKEFLPAKLPKNWSSLDFWYDEGHASLKVFQPEQPSREVNAAETNDYTEVGIFSIAEDSTPEDLTLVGARLLYNDEDDDPNFVHRTLFHVKPRHRQIEHAEIEYVPNGMHPKFVVDSVPPVPKAEDVGRCSLYGYLTLDKLLIFDSFQVPEGLNVIGNFGSKDLELPEYAVSNWGNEILLEITEDTPFPLELTLHSRYQKPQPLRLHRKVTIDKPVLFYGCEGLTESHLLKASPFDNKRPIGGSFEKFFTDDTIFFHMLDRGQYGVSIPSAALDSSYVNLVTFVALSLGVSFILIKSILRVFSTRVSTSKKQQ